MSNTYYTRDHEYIRVDGDTGVVGVTDHAQHALGDIVYVELPEVGASFKRGDQVAVVESVKAASEVFAPVTGEVVAINGALLHKFAMVGEGVGEKRTVALEFLIYLPATKPLHEWEWDATHAEFFVESVKAQGSLDLSGEAEEEEDDEESTGPVLTQPPPGERIKVMPPAAKSGPKELAAHHAAQGAPAGHTHIEPPTATSRRRPGMRPN